MPKREFILTRNYILSINYLLVVSGRSGADLECGLGEMRGLARAQVPWLLHDVVCVVVFGFVHLWWRWFEGE